MHPYQDRKTLKLNLQSVKYSPKWILNQHFGKKKLDENSPYLTLFHTNGKLYRSKRLTMGLEPAQAELNATLRPIFADISNMYLIHDDLTIATQTMDEHLTTLKDVMNAILKSGLTLNPSKCTFEKNEINF